MESTRFKNLSYLSCIDLFFLTNSALPFQHTQTAVSCGLSDFHKLVMIVNSLF